MINDSSYVVNIQFSDEERYEFDDIMGAMPSIQVSDKQISIEYNFVASTMKISSTEKFINKFETNYEEKPRILLGSIWYKDLKLYLKDINTMTVTSSGEYTLFRTLNSAETQNIVTKISDTQRDVTYNDKGEVISDETVHYVSTDYSSGDVVLKLLMKMK